jgi:hypothetical protein
MRMGVVLAALLSVVFVAATFAAAGSDTGRDRPPAALTNQYKVVWMGEWAACRHEKLGRFAAQIGVKITSGRSPQVVAKLIAKTAEAALWNLQQELDTAVDGCRNGILWRYYHE